MEFQELTDEQWEFIKPLRDPERMIGRL